MMNIVSKILLAVTALIVSAVSYANTGYYVQGDVLASKLEMKDNEGTWKKNQTGGRVAVGKDTGAIRYQADYAFFGKLKETDEVDTYSWDIHSLGVSAIYDFNAVSGFTPYVGARLGVNSLKYKDSEESLRKTKVGAGVLGGVQYDINKQLSINAGIEYNYLGKVDEVKANQYGANLGLRYNF